MREPNDYGSVADLYDTYVPATFDIPFFLNEAKKLSGEALELMSGTGRVSIPLLQAGVRLTCVDLSAEMNAVLRAKMETLGLHAELHQMDICELSLSKQFDLVIIPFHSFAHIVSPADQHVAFRRIHQHLSPSGRFICTLGNPAVRRASVDGKLRLHSRYSLGSSQGTLLLWLLEKFNPDDDQIVEALEFFEEYDDREMLRSKRLLELRFRLSRREEIEALAASEGFEVAALYGDYEYSEFHEESSPFMIWLFRPASSNFVDRAGTMS